MSKMLTTEEFIRRAREMHGDKYDYSKSVYSGSSNKVTITCLVHGEFEQLPLHHTKGNGCPLCAKESLLSDTSTFITRATQVHGGKYDYSKTNYSKSNEKVEIICPIHGVFTQLASNHLSGQGCPKCGRDDGAKARLLSREEFITKSKEIHGEKYDYSKVDYKGGATKVCIICPIHGEFWQWPTAHMQGHGCPDCSREKSKKLVCGVGINDYPLPIKRNGRHIQSYHIWQEMLSRCYTKRKGYKGATYDDCYVCQEWFYFSKFKEWFDEHYVEGWDLDKDILVKGNKIYSPNTCCFVPTSINVIVKGTQFHKTPCGVRPYKGGYKCEITKRGKNYAFYKFRTPEDAFLKYKTERENYIHELGEEYKDKLEPRVYDALMNYKIEITD